MNTKGERDWEDVTLLNAIYAGVDVGLLHNWPGAFMLPKPKRGTAPVGSPEHALLEQSDIWARVNGTLVPLVECKHHTGPNCMLEVMGWDARKLSKDKIYKVEFGTVSGIMKSKAAVLAQRVRSEEIYLDMRGVIRMVMWAESEGEKPHPCNSRPGENHPTWCHMTPPASYTELYNHGTFTFKSGRKYTWPKEDREVLERMVIRQTSGFRTIEEVKKEYGV